MPRVLGRQSFWLSPSARRCRVPNKRGDSTDAGKKYNSSCVRCAIQPGCLGRVDSSSMGNLRVDECDNNPLRSAKQGHVTTGHRRAQLAHEARGQYHTLSGVPQQDFKYSRFNTSKGREVTVVKILTQGMGTQRGLVLCVCEKLKQQFPHLNVTDPPPTHANTRDTTSEGRGGPYTLAPRIPPAAVAMPARVTYYYVATLVHVLSERLTVEKR